LDADNSDARFIAQKTAVADRAEVAEQRRRDLAFKKETEKLEKTF
jgi:hypothetical protein